MHWGVCLLLVLIVLHRIVALGRKNKICRNELSALMEELIEGMLRVSGWFSEQNGTCGVLDVLAAAGYGLSVGFHG